MTKEEVMQGLKDVLLVLKPKTDLSGVTPDTNLVTDLGIDSLSLMLLSLAIEDKFSINFDSAVSFKTVGEVIDYIISKL